jgi:hypothetical protein
MQPQPQLSGWQPFIGSWMTEATHPAFPGVVVAGRSTFEWLDGRRFVVWRSHHEHAQLPDALSVIGVTDERLAMHYFDSRGVYRVYTVSIAGGEWRFWRDQPGFSQRYTATLSDDGGTISGRGELSLDDSSWEPDLAVTYSRVPGEGA